MEKEKSYDDVYKELMKEVAKPISKKVLQELSKNPMMVGRDLPKDKIQFLWQPHNYRLYFDFSKHNFNPPKQEGLYKYPTLEKLDSRVSRVEDAFRYTLKNHKSEHHFDNFYGCRVVIKKTVVEVINKWHEKQWRLIQADNITDIDKRITEVTMRLDNQCTEALKRILRLFGGTSQLKVLKRRGEHGIHGDDYLDKIPDNMIIQDTVFKKVYTRKAEFYDPTYIKNYVSNRTIENIAPEIANEIGSTKELVQDILKVNASTSNMFNNFAKSFLPTFTEFSRDVRVHNKVLKGIEKSFKKFNKLLSEKQTKLGDWK